MSPAKKASGKAPGKTLRLVLENNGFAQQVFGPHNSHLARIEQRLGVSIVSRGNELDVTGSADAVETARRVVEGLYRRLGKGLGVDRDQGNIGVGLAEDIAEELGVGKGMVSLP